MQTITLEKLQSLLQYDKDTGEFYWKYNPAKQISWNTRYAGKLAGGLNTQGYWVIRIDNILYRAHHLAWVYVQGYWTKYELDHIDGNRANNKIANLREATRRENARNMSSHKGSTSKYKGVCWHSNAWRATIWDGSKQINLGRYKSEEEAAKVYQVKANELFQSFAKQ